MEGGIPDERQSKAQRGGIAEHRPKLKGSECAPQMAPLLGDFLVELGWHHANTPLLAEGQPITLAAPNTVLRRGDGDR